MNNKTKTMDKLVINANRLVFVKLRDKGYDMWQRHLLKSGTLKFSSEIRRYKLTDKGYHYFQIHEFMEIFGGDNIALGYNDLFENDILFNKCDFKEINNG